VLHARERRVPQPTAGGADPAAPLGVAAGGQGGVEGPQALDDGPARHQVGRHGEAAVHVLALREGMEELVPLGPGPGLAGGEPELDGAADGVGRWVGVQGGDGRAQPVRAR